MALLNWTERIIRMRKGSAGGASALASGSSRSDRERGGQISGCVGRLSTVIQEARRCGCRATQQHFSSFHHNPPPYLN
jgi:hypothetical protein